MSGEAFHLEVRGYPWEALPELATQLGGLDDGRGETIRSYLIDLGVPSLAAEHTELLARMERMAGVYRSLCWHLASDAGRESTIRNLRQLTAYRPDGTDPGPFGPVTVIHAGALALDRDQYVRDLIGDMKAVTAGYVGGSLGLTDDERTALLSAATHLAGAVCDGPS